MVDFSVRVIITPPYPPARWPVPVMVIVVIVTMMGVRLGYLPPQWIALAAGTGLAAVRAAVPARPATPEIGG